MKRFFDFIDSLKLGEIRESTIYGAGIGSAAIITGLFVLAAIELLLELGAYLCEIIGYTRGEYWFANLWPSTPPALLVVILPAILGLLLFHFRGGIFSMFDEEKVPLKNKTFFLIGLVVVIIGFAYYAYHVGQYSQ